MLALEGLIVVVVVVVVVVDILSSLFGFAQQGASQSIDTRH